MASIDGIRNSNSVVFSPPSPVDNTPSPTREPLNKHDNASRFVAAANSASQGVVDCSNDPSGFTNSTGIQFSPPSPADDSSTASRYSSPDRPREPRTSVPVPRLIPKDISAKSADINASPAETRFQPPPGPRSMRRNISPPVLRRSYPNKYSDPGRISPEPGYRRNSGPQYDEYPRSVRLTTTTAWDTYRPGPSRAWEGARRRSPDRAYNHGPDTQSERPGLGSNVWKAPGYDKRLAPHASKAFSGNFAQTATTDELIEAAVFKGREAARIVARKISRHGTDSIPCLDGLHDPGYDNSSARQEEATRKGEDSHGNSEEGRIRDIGVEALRRIGLAHPQFQLTGSSLLPQNFNLPHNKAPENRLPLTSSFTAGEACIPSVERLPELEPAFEAYLPLKRRTVDRPGPGSEDIASTPSLGTTGSRNKNICRACRKPGSSVSQLVPCRTCHKGYHEHCGNPKPRQSGLFEDFICGRCLKKQAAATNKPDSGRNSLDHYSPPETLVAVDHPHLSTLSKETSSMLPNIDSSLSLDLTAKNGSLPYRVPTDPLISHEPPQSHRDGRDLAPSAGDLSLNSTKDSQEEARRTTEHSKHKRKTDQLEKLVSLKPFETDIRAFPLPATRGSEPDRTEPAERYRHITCPSWARGGCWFEQQHCLFAHRSTGWNAPPGKNVEARAFTCPDWQARSCPLAPRQCLYAHNDTGLYIGTDGKASLKHITCWYWKFRIACPRTDTECLYGHRDTSVVAWQPLTLAIQQPGPNSLKEFTCPRFETRGQCRFESFGTCPYLHRMSGKSCVNHPNNEQQLGSLRSDNVEDQSKDASNDQLPGTGLAAQSEESSHPTRSPTTERAPQSCLPKTTCDLFPNKPPTTSLEDSVVLSPRDAVEQKAIASEPLSGLVATTTSGAESTTVSETAAACAPGTHAVGIGMARRGGRSKRSLPRKPKSLNVFTEEAVPDATLTTQLPVSGKSLEAELPGTASPSSRTPTESSGSIVRRQCKECRKMIYSSRLYCASCVKGQQSQRHEETSVSDFTSNILPVTRMDPYIVVSDDSTESTRIDALIHGRASLGAAAVQQNYAGLDGNTKPISAESYLFVKKKPRLDPQLVREAAIHALSQGRRGGTREDPLADSTTRSVNKTRTSRAAATNPANQQQQQLDQEHHSGEEANFTPSAYEDSAGNFSREGSMQASSRTTTEPLPTSPKVCAPQMCRDHPAQILGKRTRRQVSTQYLPDYTFVTVSTAEAMFSNDNTTNKDELTQGEHGVVIPNDKQVNVVAENDDTPAKSSRHRALTTNLPSHAMAGEQPPIRVIGTVDHGRWSGPQSPTANTQSTRTTCSESSSAQSQRSSACARCRAAHDRCWHKIDGSPHPVKSSLLVQDHLRKGPPGFKPIEWTKLLKAAEQVMPGNLFAGTVENSVPENAERGERVDAETTDVQDDLLAASLTPTMGDLADNAESNSCLSRPSTRGETFAASAIASNSGQSSWSEEMENRAIERLKARGVMFESDSEKEEQEKVEDCFQGLPPRSTDPLLRRPDRSRNLFDIDPTLDMTKVVNGSFNVDRASLEAKVSKKSLVGNLLQHQCAENRKRFGNPHASIRRAVEEVSVTTTVQSGINFDGPRGPEAKKDKVSMTFRDFLGVPKQPIIEARKEQMVFREKEQVQQVAGRSGRRRRVKESEVFPFSA